VNPSHSEAHYRLGKSDVFHFECTACGDCCRGDIDIFLNAQDLWRMLGFTGFSAVRELFDASLVTRHSLKGGGYRPKIKFKTRPAVFCPFLENSISEENELKGNCKLHPTYKPLVCKTAPFGRVIDDTGENQWWFTEPISGCPGCAGLKTNSVSDLIGEHSSDFVLEQRYFEVLDHLQSIYAPISEWDRFHFGIRIDERVEDYIERWKTERPKAS
jgi:Fe-S-cluster containining protein